MAPGLPLPRKITACLRMRDVHFSPHVASRQRARICVVGSTMTGKTVLVTGAGRGIGYEAAKLLSGMGATVYITDISSTAIQQATDLISSQAPGVDIRAAPAADLGSQTQVTEFCAEFTSSTASLDVLVNNAGANFLGVAPWHTAQGVAGLPQVNIVGPMHLTMRLLPLLLRSPSPRIVNVASIMHRHAAVPPPDEFLRDWWLGGSYRNCKLVLVALSQLLNTELGGGGLVTSCADPGFVNSGLWSTSPVFSRPPVSWLLSAISSPPSDAALPVVHCASHPDVQPGGYYARGMFASPLVISAVSEPLSGALACLDWPLRSVSGGEWCSDVQQVAVSPSALNLVGARALWDAIADLSGMPRGFKHLKAGGQQGPVEQPVLPPGFMGTSYHSG